MRTEGEWSVWKAPATEERRLIDGALRTCYDTAAMRRTKNAGAVAKADQKGCLYTYLPTSSVTIPVFTELGTLATRMESENGKDNA
jgi:hypothetical protein